MANKLCLGDFLCGCAFLVVVGLTAASPQQPPKETLVLWPAPLHKTLGKEGGRVERGIGRPN